MVDIRLHLILPLVEIVGIYQALQLDPHQLSSATWSLLVEEDR